MSLRWGHLIVWHLVRATSTQPAPNSKPAGSPPCDIYTSLGGATHTSSVTEVAEWVRTLAPPDPSPPLPVLSPPPYTPPTTLPPPPTTTLADIGTKALDPKLFCRLRDMMCGYAERISVKKASSKELNNLPEYDNENPNNNWT